MDQVFETNDETKLTQEAADWLHGYFVGLHLARTEDPAIERELDVDNNSMMDGYNDTFNFECGRLGKNPIEVVEKMDNKVWSRWPSNWNLMTSGEKAAWTRKENQRLSAAPTLIKHCRVRNAAETQLWNDAVDYFQSAVRRGDELVIPVLPGRSLSSMYTSMRAAFRRRGTEAIVKQCTNSRWRYRMQGGWIEDHYGKPCLVIIHRGESRRAGAKQHNFFDYHGPDSAVVYFNEEPFYGTYVGEEGDKLVFSLIWNDDEKIVKFGKAYCNKSGQYTWIVRG